MIIVGSTALKFYGLNRAEPKDVDWWASWQIAQWMTGADVAIMPESIIDAVPTSPEGYATSDAVYTIKCSHLAWDIKWEKTKNDILWLKSRGCALLPELYSALVEHWKVEHGDKSFLSLSKGKENFFNDHVTYVYDHDHLHRVVASPGSPMYERCLKDGEEVLIDKTKFDKLPFEDQVRMFREEIAVIAIERWLVNPHWKGRVSWYKAHGLALKKTITSLTKNWATDFIVQHLEEFVKPYFSYFENINELEEGLMSKVDMKVFKDLLVVSEHSHMDKLILSLADGDFDEYTNEVYSLAEDDADAEVGTAWMALKYNDPERAEPQRMYWAVKSAAIEKYKEQLGKVADYERLDQNGGGEGGSEDCDGVFRLDGKIYRAAWSYYSHNGYEYDGIVDTLREVSPVQKVVIIYE